MKREFVTKSCSVVLSAIFLLSPGEGSAYAQASYPPEQYPPPSGQYPPPQPYPQGQYPQQPPPQYPQPQYPPPQGQPYPQVQSPYAPPRLASQQLDQMVGPIALYSDPLLAQVLTASTFVNEIPDAANWANQHNYLRGPELAAAIQADSLPWDPSVLALLPFPSVLNYMATNMGWTQELGNAVLAQRADVMDAVQRMRQQAYNYGYLRTNGYYRVIFAGPGDIEIAPVNPDLYYVPVYNPYIVYAPPRRGVAVAAVIGLGAAIVVGAAFRPWGWGHPALEWRQHAILIDNRPWNRTWATRGVYARPEYHSPGPRIERHDVRGPEHSRGGDHRRGDHRDDHR